MIIFIAGLLALKGYFIFKGAANENRSKRLLIILIIAIIITMISVTLFFYDLANDTTKY